MKTTISKNSFPKRQIYWKTCTKKLHRFHEFCLKGPN